MSNQQPDHTPHIAELATRMFDHARQGQTQTLDAHLRAGLPVNLTNDQGNTLLMLAAHHGHPDTVATLITHGADLDRLNDHGHSPLSSAVFQGRSTIVALLTHHGADPDTGTPTARENAHLLEASNYLTLFDTPP
ncbi:ankyrin repeat domain-containing protein [Nocardiopsis kunsanensis]|uniref:Ankyrin repeat domain-containing protein n=1 Tax=Nocardiopsis kunsanensis TaxID=141693 RepID=A0A918X9C4_9ACTN|nr:ankyrin repeat domain-containing protein [Nocardiopsis kunsanensis]GHD19748.1 hypothetical protein GCM10007147_10940 [Nocardiopsis kunsanensis]